MACARSRRAIPPIARSYGGGVRERDGGYHRAGLGLAARPILPRTLSRHAATQRQHKLCWLRCATQLEDQGVGTIGEIFDGDPPHQPRGAPAQAWSVACTLDAWRLLGRPDMNATTPCREPHHRAIDRHGARLERKPRTGTKNWRRWGPYVSERQWGTVREDYSPDGNAWDYLTHDQARSRAYRWGEDGIAGFCDDRQLLCLVARPVERRAIRSSRSGCSA